MVASASSFSSVQPSHDMKLYIRNFAYGALFIIVLSILRTLPLNSDSGEHVHSDSVARQRFRRDILDWRTTSDQKETQNVTPRLEYASSEETFSDLREGPAVDLGRNIPAKLGKDVFITVKTTFKYHRTRLQDILDTWFRLAPDNIFFFSDKKDEELQKITGKHLIDTKCSGSHSRQALCCKMGVEFDYYIQSGKSWFCHFDDDNYVNVPELMRLLSMYDPRKDWYLGRPSTRGPIQIIDRERDTTKSISFWFATGGAGFCISRSLAMKMAPYASKGKFISLGERIRLPDDVTMGFLIEHLLGKRLTVVDRFHSHLESMKSMHLDSLHEQVSLSAGSYNNKDTNVVPIQGHFNQKDDPNRFRSIHCFLFPNAHVCPKLGKAAQPLLDDKSGMPQRELRKLESNGR